MTGATLMEAGPMLRSGTVIAPDGDSVLVVSPSGAQILRGSRVAALARAVLPLMDGERDLAGIAAALPSVAPDTIQSLLEALTSAGAVTRSPSSPSKTGRLVTLLSDALTARGAHPTVAGDGLLEVDGVRIAVACDGPLAHLLALSREAPDDAPTIFVFEHPAGRFVVPVLDGAVGPCLTCFRLRLRGAALVTREQRALDDTAFGRLARHLIAASPWSAADDALVRAACDVALSWRHQHDSVAFSVSDDGALQCHPLIAHPLCDVCSGDELSGLRPNDPLQERLDALLDPVTGVLTEVHIDPLPPEVQGVPSGSVFAACLAAQGPRGWAPGVFAPAGMAYSSDPAEARMRAMMEALERYGLETFDPRDAVAGSFNELTSEAVDPRDLALYAPEQYTAPGFPLRPFDPNEAYPWVRATTLDGRQRLIPAGFVSWNTPNNRLVRETSNGAAAHTSRDEALLRGLCEIVERDAIMLTWYARIAPPRLDEDGLPEETATFLAAARAGGYRVSLRLLRLDHGVPVVLAVARRSDGVVPALMLGAGCSPDVRRAAASAVREMFTLYVASLQAGPEAWTDPGPAEWLRTPPQHLHFYARGAHAGALDLLEQSTELVSAESLSYQSQGATADLKYVAGELHSHGFEPLCAEFTPRDLRPRGFVMTKAFVPGMVPLHAGERFRRLGARRLFDLPAHLGHAPRPLTAADLNPLPHPFP